MARQIHRRLILKACIEAQTPLHVGGADEGIVVDMPVAVDGQGRPYVPGTSLAGAIRSWMASALGEVNKDCNGESCENQQWWGYQNDDKGAASRIVVEDALIYDPSTEIWHGVGIDREWGTASAGIKFDREVLPKGTRFALRLYLDVPDSGKLETARGLLGHLVQALRAGNISLGAASTRGLGKVRLVGAPECLEHDWSSKAGVLNILECPGAGEDQSEAWQQATAFVPMVSPRLVDVAIHWRPAGPVMVRAPYDGLAVDALPMVSNDGSLVAMVLPGSSVKGVLRSQAERILRTLLHLDLKESDKNRRHQEQLDLPLIRDVFGIAKEKNTGRRGALVVDTCYATIPTMSRAQWENLASAVKGDDDPGSPIPEALEGTGAGQFQHAYHVAVDRWTGGAADNLLFSGIEPFGVQWEPLRFRLDLCRLSSAKAAFALVWLVLRDLREGMLTIGFGGNRGYGAVTIDKIAFSGALCDLGCDLGSITLNCEDGEPNLQPLNAWLVCLEQSWAAWLDEQMKEEINDHETA